MITSGYLCGRRADPVGTDSDSLFGEWGTHELKFRSHTGTISVECFDLLALGSRVTKRRGLGMGSVRVRGRRALLEGVSVGAWTQRTGNAESYFSSRRARQPRVQTGFRPRGT